MKKNTVIIFVIIGFLSIIIPFNAYGYKKQDFNKLGGIDSNNNMVRDDIEIYINKNYDKSKQLKLALIQYATAMQKGILAVNQKESMEAGDSLVRSMECLRYITPNKKHSEQIAIMILNNPERIKAWNNHESRISGKVFPSCPIKKRKKSCSFNTDNISN